MKLLRDMDRRELRLLAQHKIKTTGQEFNKVLDQLIKEQDAAKKRAGVVDEVEPPQQPEFVSECSCRCARLWRHPLSCGPSA